MLVRQRTVACGLLIVMAACGGSKSASTTTTIERRDSSGVTIVTVPGAVLDSLPRWSLGAPATRLGGGDSTVDLLLHVAGAWRLDDDEIVVADGSALQLRVFDSGARYLRAYGRRGAGPGEYQSFWKVSAMAGDWIAIYDYPLSRVTRLNLRTGQAISRQIDRTACDRQQYPEDKWTCNIESLLSDGDWLVRREAMRSYNPDPQPATVYPSVPRFVHLVSDSMVRVVDSGISEETFRVVGKRSSYFSAFTLFSPESQFAAGDSVLVFGTSNRYELKVYRDNGIPKLIIRVARDAVPVTTQSLEPIRAWADSAKGAMPPAKDYVRDYSPTGNIPYFGELRVDRAGRIWVKDYYPPGTLAGLPDRYQWTVFGADGTPEARVAIRPEGEIMELGRDYALLLRRDSDGVETVVLEKFVREGQTTK